MTEQSLNAPRSLPREYRLVFIGGGGVGQTCLIGRFIHGRFIEDSYDPAHEDHYRKQCVIDDEIALLDITDTDHDHIFYGTIRRFEQSGEGFVLVYSITSRITFEQIDSFRQGILRTKNTTTFPMIIVANKCDMEHERQVSVKEGQDLAKEFGCMFIETSVKQGVNVEEVLHNIVREIRRYDKGHHSGGPQVPEPIEGISDTTARPQCFSGCVMT